MKLNVGCGFSKQAGYVNVDKFAACEPDQLMDAEAFPWPFDDNSADEILFNHSLEHMGADPAVFLRLIQEIYRVCRPGAQVRINVPHPRHDDFLNDPTHVRAITPDMLCLFSKRQNEIWRTSGAANSLFAFYLDVDFEIRHARSVLDPRYDAAFARGQINDQLLADMERAQNNVISAYEILLEAKKPAQPLKA